MAGDPRQHSQLSFRLQGTSEDQEGDKVCARGWWREGQPGIMAGHPQLLAICLFPHVCYKDPRLGESRAGWLHPGAIPASDTGLAWSQSERFVDQLNEQVDSQEYNSGKSSCPARGHGSLP